MVSGHLRRTGIALILGAVGVALAATAWIPSISDHPGEHCAALLVKSAMAAFRQKHGRLAEDFCSYAESLTAMAGTSSTIRKVNRDRYEVNVCCADSKYRVVMSYRVDSLGQLEDYDVLGIDRICKCP